LDFTDSSRERKRLGAAQPSGPSVRRRVRRAVGAALLACLLFAPSALGADRIYWPNHNDNTISFANLDGSGGGGQLATTGAPVDGPTSVALEPATGSIYWSNGFGDTIGIANLDGSGDGAEVLTDGATLASPSGVTVDLAAGRIYWANLDNDTISFANLDGSGGGQLATTGASPSSPMGVAIDPAAGRVYWANFHGNTISFADLDGSGGGQLSTAGAPINHPSGVAIDAEAGRIYWTNQDNTISFANLDGSGGGQLSTAGATVDAPGFPALLKAPAGTGAPEISGDEGVGQELECDGGTWAPDLPGSFLYRAPRTFGVQWQMNGTAIPGATEPTYMPSVPGEYSCRVTATNVAGSASQTSAPRAISAVPPNALEITGLERDRAAGTATLTVATNVAGALRVAKTNKVKPAGPVNLTGAGEVEVEVVPRNRTAEKLRRTGRITVNPQVRFAPAIGGELGVRHKFDLRQG
jgi:hypothetical protein